MVIIRRFKNQDAQSAAALIAETLRTTNAADYSAAYLQKLTNQITPTWLCQKAAATHFYVATANQQIVGTAAIGAYWGRTDESSLFTIFVAPTFQGQGLGRRLVTTLEHDPYFIRAHRIEVPASITAHRFYEHLGYHEKAGEQFPDQAGLYRLEKFNSKEG